MAVNKITKRWLYNSFSVILAIIIAFVLIFSYGIRAYFYNNVEQILISRANVINTLMVNYSEDSSVDFASQVRQLVENFEDKDKIELMAIDGSGKVIITSSGFKPEGNPVMPDYEAAPNSDDLIGHFTGTINGEKVMAITRMSDVADENVAGMRYVVSLDLVDRQIILYIILITLVGMAIMFFVIFTSTYFIQSIILPVEQVGETARKIAGGDFGVRLEKKNDDEIGQLCETINYMAEELSTTEKMKNDFISSVSHELRTPLTAIKGWGETLQSDVSGDHETLQKGMRVIISETERLSTMVEDLLDFSRMQSGRLNIKPVKLDIVAELSDAVLMFTERARQEGIGLIYREPDELVTIMGDRNRLRQVFVNILDNALKYSDKGDSVSVSASRKGNKYIVTIADTGSGIHEHDLAKVKTKFYKGDSSRRGSGIGLAVADEIIAMHGGNLDISSKKDVGTTVTITLPIDAPASHKS